VPTPCSSSLTRSVRWCRVLLLRDIVFIHAAAPRSRDEHHATCARLWVDAQALSDSGRPPVRCVGCWHQRSNRCGLVYRARSLFIENSGQKERLQRRLSFLYCARLHPLSKTQLERSRQTSLRLRINHPQHSASTELARSSCCRKRESRVEC
jgi:hypothetical protein